MTEILCPAPLSDEEETTIVQGCVLPHLGGIVSERMAEEVLVAEVQTITIEDGQGRLLIEMGITELVAQ